MNGLQCDTCRVFAPVPLPEGWLLLLRQEAPSFSPMASLLGGGGSGGQDLAGTFCCLRCLAEWAYVALAAEGTPGSAPGTDGWLG